MEPKKDDLADKIDGKPVVVNYHTTEQLFKSRTQCKKFSRKKIPDRSLVEKLLNKTFELVPSKQNLVPYKVKVLGPEHSKLKRKFEDIIVQNTAGGGGDKNYNVSSAPYDLLFTTRLVKPNEHIQERIRKGHPYKTCDAEIYKWQKIDYSIEIGMFASVLTGLCMENKIDVSYLLCFPNEQQHYENFPLDGENLIFSMQLGYKDVGVGHEYIKDESEKPLSTDVIEWV